jgi:hypothetical protein
MTLDQKALSMENEIRRLKMELLRQELDDRMINLKFLMEKRRQMNETMNNGTAVNGTKTEDDVHIKYFGGSVLFLKVAGDFEVWHFVVLTLFVWFLISI